MAYALSLSDTVAKLATESSVTLGWDVVVNYSEPAINDLLAERFKNEPKKQIQELKFEISSFDVVTAKTTKVFYDLGLGAPLISFNSRGADGPTCNLAFPVTGGTAQVQDGPTETVSAGLYTVVFGTLFLASAGGSTNSNVKSGNESFVLPDDGKDGCVIIDLPTSKYVTVAINIDKSSTAPHSPLIDNEIPLMCQSIKNQLHSDGKYKDIRYELARVDSHPPPAGSIQLKPKSFRFDAFLPSDNPKPGDVGTLTLFIQTRDQNHGTQSNLATAWESKWRTTLLCSPIPKGETASIIFSKSMVYESIIQPALKDKGFSGKGLKLTIGSLEVEIDTGKHVHRDKFFYRDPPQGDPLGDQTYTADAVAVTLPPLTLTLKEDSGSATYATSWKYQYTCGWIYTTSGPSGPYGAIVTQTTHGSTTAYHTMPKNPDQHPKLVTLLDDYDLTMDCSVSKDDWDVKYVPEQQSAWDEFWRGKETSPKWVKDLDVGIPSFDIQLGRFDFFWTTNLLLPGGKRVIDIDRKVGLHIPGDLYLVGKVETK